MKSNPNPIIFLLGVKKTSQLVLDLEGGGVKKPDKPPPPYKEYNHHVGPGDPPKCLEKSWKPLKRNTISKQKTPPKEPHKRNLIHIFAQMSAEKAKGE